MSTSLVFVYLRR